MPVERIPGEKMYTIIGSVRVIDTDPSTGEIRKVHVFTTSLALVVAGVC